MKHLRLFQLLLLALTLMPHASALAAGSKWYPVFATPRLYAEAQGQYEREAVLPDEDDIDINIDDYSYRTNREAAQVLVVPPGSTVFGTNPHTARAYTDFGQNHAEAYSFFDFEGYSEEGPRYFDRRFSRSFANSYWVDHWTFSGVGGGSATVTLSVGVDVNINTACADAVCLGVGNPVLTRSGFRDWLYIVDGFLAVFDLDQLDQNVPRKVAAFDIYQEGWPGSPDFLVRFGNVITNGRLASIHTNGTLSFVPVAGHRYATAGFIGLQAESGVNLDASHTMSLNRVVLDPGLRLHSVSTTNHGAQFNVLDATKLALTRSGGDVMLSFPSAEGITYHLEYKTALNASAWMLLATRNGNNTSQSITDPITGVPSRFYRLRVEYP